MIPQYSRRPQPSGGVTSAATAQSAVLDARSGAVGRDDTRASGGAFVSSAVNTTSAGAAAIARTRRIPQSLSIEGVAVSFPFMPYPCQVDFMRSLVHALQTRENGLLESPTGTGKTLCLLCGALAWQKAYSDAQRALLAEARGEVRYEDTPRRAAMLAAAGMIVNLDALGAAAAGPIRAGDALLARLRSSTPAGENTTGAHMAAGMAPPPIDVPSLQSLQKPPKIIYASRTHSQLSQVIRELKNSAYAPKIAVLGSREQLCVHSSVSKLTGSAQNYACRTLVRERRCNAWLTLQEMLDRGGRLDAFAASAGLTQRAGGSRPGGGAPVMDIEELAEAGARSHTCSYYLPRDDRIQADAELILAPYNYLLDPVVRRQTLSAIDWRNAVVIFDEAHNIEETSSESASFDFTAGELSRCIDELSRAATPFMSSADGGPLDPSSAAEVREPGFDPKDVVALHDVLRRLEAHIDSLPTGNDKDGTGLPQMDARVFEGEYIFELFKMFNITFATLELMDALLMAVVDFLAARDTAMSIAAAGPRASAQARPALALENFRSMLARIFRNEAEALANAQYYRVVIHRPSARETHGASSGARVHTLNPVVQGRTLSYWCFSPGVAMKEMKALGVRSILLASGTLSPMDTYAAELQIPFAVRLENPHVVAAEQVHVSVLTRGVTNRALNSSYEHRDTIEYKQELGNTLVNLVRIVPDGVLVFFPSYRALEMCTTAWKTDGADVWRKFMDMKACVAVEARSAPDFAQQIRDFNLAVDTGRGAIMFAVCRGKVSEGIDFSDAHGRAVIVTGLPFSPLYDPKVVLKRRYLDKVASIASGAAASIAAADRLTGAQWYQLQAFRAVNQAIGRVIRHRKDYGAIMMVDERFARDRGSVSAWLRSRVQVYEKVGSLISSLATFFRTAPAAVADLDRVDAAAAAATADGIVPEVAPAIHLPAPSETPLNMRPSPVPHDPDRPLMMPPATLDAIAPQRAGTPTPGSALVAPIPVSAAANDRSSVASAFMQRAAAVVNPESMAKFKTALAELRAKTRAGITDEVLQNVISISVDVFRYERCEGTVRETRKQLLHELVQFIPPRMRDSCKKMIAAYEVSIDVPGAPAVAATPAPVSRPPPAAAAATAAQSRKHTSNTTSSISSHRMAAAGVPAVAAVADAYDIVTGRRPGADRPAARDSITAGADARKKPRMDVAATAAVVPALFPPPAAALPTIHRAATADATGVSSTTMNAAAMVDLGEEDDEGDPAAIAADECMSATAAVPSTRAERASPVRLPTVAVSLKCAVCLEASTIVGAHVKCGHICCMACWRLQMENRQECPVCRHIARSNMVVQLHFN